MHLFLFSAHAQDPHSYAKPWEARITHVHLDLTIDFDYKKLKGKVVLDFETSDHAEFLTLDTRNLIIQKVLDSKTNAALPFVLGTPDDILGQELKIRLKPKSRKVTIFYETSPESFALQWLSPQQTAGGKFPFVYTQSQAILCRSWIPIQDSPGIRFTYTAEVHTRPGLLALMSAENSREIQKDGHYKFLMKKPIPAYLMALASGRLAFAEISPSIGVYAEPEMLKQAVSDFSDIPKMLETAESLYGPYLWGRYDILLMPPSFPFGGMENPCLTFSTPTILTGDKSLTSLIAHELAHSWSGNLTTNATWNDFWLNEGFTVYLERRIMEKIYGTDYSDMLEVLGYQDLEGTIEELKKENRWEDTRLRLSLKGRDPDEAMNDIAYEKGFLLLRQIRNFVGSDKMDELLRAWFSRNAFKSVSTDDFIKYLNEELPNSVIHNLQLSEWIESPGLPRHTAPVSKLFSECRLAASSYLENHTIPKQQWMHWNSHQKQKFLRHLEETSISIFPKELSLLDQNLGLSENSNKEELFIWLLLAIKNGLMDVLPALDKFLTEVGRRKFVFPLFRALIESPNLRDWTLERYQAEWRQRYHFLTASSIEKLIGQ